MKILITGIAGFIGFHLARALTEQGHSVVGLDNYNNIVYGSNLKRDRAQILKDHHWINIHEMDISEKNSENWFTLPKKCDMIIHLAALANPRIAMKYPHEYVSTNINGTQNIIDYAKSIDCPRVLYASSSSALTGNKTPWSEDLTFNHMPSAYGWSKFVNECQFKFSGLPSSVAMRFFTVFGTWYRPDMAIPSFTQKLIHGNPVEVYHYGKVKRDFTHINDTIQAINCIIDNPTEGHDIFNIGRGQPVLVRPIVEQIAKTLGSGQADIRDVEGPLGEPAISHCDMTKLQKLGFSPTTNIEDGVDEYIRWHMDYYDKSNK